MRIEGRVGVSRYTDDQEGPPRLGSQGELVVGELNPKFYEQTMRGNAFVYSAAAAGAVLAALGTTTAPFLWNPAGSGVNLVITKIAVGLDATGTAAAGHIVYGYQTNMGASVGTGAPVVSLTAVPGVNLLLGAGKMSVVRFAPTTVLLASACSFLCTAGMGQATTATTATPPFQFIDYVDGMIVIPPGSAFTVAASAAIASSYTISVCGLELPVPLTQ